MVNFKLQRLRIPSGWEVIINSFLDVDVTQYSSDDTIWRGFTENILHIRSTLKKKDIAIDLGQYPENDVSGAFHLMVIKNNNWKEPVEEINSRNKDEIVDKIEEFLLKYIQIGYINGTNFLKSYHIKSISKGTFLNSWVDRENLRW